MSTRARKLPLTQGLPQYTRALTERLDEALGDADRNSDMPALRSYYDGNVRAYRLALSYPHIWTDGRYGTSLEAQPTDTTEET